MSSLFGTRAPLLADLVLVAEALIAALLVYASARIRRGDVNLHRRLMTLATLIQIGAVIGLMIPASMASRSLYLAPNIANFVRTYLPLHMLIGVLLLGLALFLVLVMANYPKPRRWRPIRFKLLMQVLLVTWLLTLAGGTLFSYFLKYVL